MQDNDATRPRSHHDDPPQDRPAAARDALILEIAQRRFFLETLEIRNSDRLDFHDVAVWSIRAALIEAYAAGLAAARR